MKTRQFELSLTQSELQQRVQSAQSSRKNSQEDLCHCCQCSFGSGGDQRPARRAPIPTSSLQDGITEQFELEETLKTISFQPRAMGRDTFH